MKVNHVSFNRSCAFPRSEMWEEIIKNGLDAFNYQGIILPKTNKTTGNTVDPIYHFFRRLFGVKERIVRRML